MNAAKLLDANEASPADDTADGKIMFFLFVAAVLASTGAVALIALVGTWWMLGFGFAIHVTMTALVLLTIFHVMTSRARPSAESARTLAAPYLSSRSGPT